MATKPIAEQMKILAANDAFYRAFESLDLRRMQVMWWHEEWVECLHPGWDLLVGWEAVEQSWEMIFRSTVRMRVVVSRPLVHVHGEVAWVSCLEHVTSAADGDFSTALVETTNIFVRRRGEWKMVHHHTTPVPDRFPTQVSTTVQ
jgi:ketosteroid isomerase-like protein